MNEQKITMHTEDSFDPELLEDIRQWEESNQEEIPGYYYSNPDPYAKPTPLSPDHVRHGCYFNESGDLCVKNISAYWIPELTVTEEISGTVYTVTGSYEGEESFLRKLERMHGINWQRSGMTCGLWRMTISRSAGTRKSRIILLRSKVG